MTASQSFLARPFIQGQLLLSVVLIVVCSGCGSSPVIDPVALDTQIEEQWLAGRETADAVEFLEKGGQYENKGLPEEVPIDQVYLLPLLKKIQKELSLKTVAVLLKPERAMAVVVLIPAKPADRNRLRELVQATHDEFPGLLLDNWGEKWLSLDFLDEREVEVLKEAGALDTLRKELEHQRRQKD